MVAMSVDGRTWDMPKEVFPMYLTRPGPISGTESGMAMMHQRMGFYVAPNGRLLVLAFYGHAPSPFGPGGIGRVVSEAYKDGTFGPLYFIKYSTMGKKNEQNTTTYPFYQRSPDKGFVEACDALLADKLKTMQWQEEDPSNDGFYTADRHEAPAVFHRKDGTAVVVWKASWAALSTDEGKSWSKSVRVPSIVTDGAKVWGQKTPDDRYALVYNPANDGSHRWPLAVATSADGIVFENLVLIDGEVAPRRYIGRAKDFGLQYVRGISEGNGVPPGSDLWVTYSGNKEDIWVSRVPIPIRFKVDGPVDDNFNQLEVGARIPDWNIYRPRWAPVGIVAFPSARNKSLQLEDRDPYNYARALRVFAEAKVAHISVKVHARQADKSRLELEVLDQASHRPVRVVFAENGRIQVANGTAVVDAAHYKSGTWYRVDLAVDAGAGKFDVSLDGKVVVRDAAFAEPAATVERLQFRTGAFRTDPVRSADRYAGGDLPNAGETAPLAVFNIDDVVVK
jgi:hypothetical protein